MAGKGKKTKKAKDAKPRDKQAQFKIPKDIGGIKIPKELRDEGQKLIEAIRGAITAQATAAAFTALSRLHNGQSRERNRGATPPNS